MTPKVLGDLIRDYTKTTAQTLPDETLLRWANVFKDEISDQIKLENEDYLIAPYFTNLVQGQREYPLDSNMLLRMKKLEVKFENEAAGEDPEWVVVEKIDINNKDLAALTTNEEKIQDTFGYTYGSVYYDYIRGSLFIYSGEIENNVTNGIKLWVATNPEDITDLSDDSTDISVASSATTIGFPKSFHRVLATRVSKFWKETREKPIPLSEQEQRIDIDLEIALRNIRRAKQGEEVVAGYEEDLNDGFNY